MESPKKSTIVLGASPDPSRYSYLAVQRLNTKQHPVTAIGIREGKIGDTPITKEHPPLENTDTVTLYLNKYNQQQYYDYILSLHPKRIIFNPGAENEELAAIAEANGIKTMEACTLVLLSTGQY